MILLGILGILIMVTLIIGFSVFYSSLAWGFILYKFWGWFLIPGFAMVFPEVVVNPINYPLAVGLFLFTIFFRIGNGQIMKTEVRDTNASLIGSLITPWLALLIGWLIKLVIM